MRVVRRRAAAMSPKEKHLLLLSAFTFFALSFYYAPSFLYAALILAVCCAACFYHSREPLPARLGQNPRAGLSVPAALRRWFQGFGVTGAPVAAAGKTKSAGSRAEHREGQGLSRNRESGIHRREVLPRNSFYFSPQDFLMGSYIGKPESPTAEPGRPRAVRNPREQLRERLSRPNHAVPTPIRRLSFAGEPLNTVGRFTITPQRHYPLQQPGVSSVGVLPPVKWDGFRKKNILSPRNSSAALSPVTVKIARPDHSTPSLDHLSCTGLSRAPADPCSRESVLRVLRESRKRFVEEDDRSFVADQRSKRRRNDSGGSAHSAFEPLLPNGTPSQLVPKPGSLKRGMTSLAEESIMKRSRTSSISSGSGARAPRGTLGSRRNAIQSSYSSSLGLGQWKRPSAPSSPLSSPGSSRCQTPEGSSKRAREDGGQSPSSASSVRSDHTASDKAPPTFKLTPVANVPVVTSSASAGSGGKRKRKIPLVSSHRDDQISLPPPPELGYTITVKDLDEEKKAGISKIQKVLETPAPEPEKSVSPPATTSTQSASSSTTAAASTTSSTTTLSSLLAAPLPKTSTSAIPVINLDPSPSISSSASSAASNPLLEALKMKISSPASSTPSASTTTVSASTTPAQLGTSSLNPTSTANSAQPPPAYQSSPAGVEKPSAFAQVLSQASKAAGSSPAAAAGSLFGLTTHINTPAASSTSNPVTTTANTTASSTNPLLASGFKPIFSVNTTSSSSTTPASESTPSAPNFKPIFGDAPAAATFGQPSSLPSANPVSTASASTTASVFGGSTSSSTVAPSPFAGLTNAVAGTTPASSVATTQPAAQPAVKSLFGNWSAPPTTSGSAAAAQVPSTGSTFQFGAAPTTTSAAPAAAPAAATTSSSQAPFSFGATQPDPQAATQKVFSFGQTAAATNTTTSPFGGFAMASSASTTTATTTQSTFAFGKTTFEAPTAPSTFGSTATQSTFGSTAAPSTFGSTAAPSTFGSTATPTTFGSTAAPSTFGSTAAPSTFGSTAAALKPFTFGNSGASPAPASNPAPTSAAAPAPFTFGSTSATTATTFGTPAKPTFGAASTGFAFGGTTASSAAPAAPPSFGAVTQAPSASSSTFTFGGAAPQPSPAGPAQPATGGFNFGGAMPCPQFGTPVSNSPAPQMGNFNFGAAAADKPAFGTSTPSFGQAAPAGPIPFGNPGTPIQGFNAAPFGSPATPSFSIGAGSKPSGARQRLQARRQHNRKK